MAGSGRFIADFGAFPGQSDVLVTVNAANITPATALDGILTTSDVEAWAEADSTTDHSADEHMVETIEAKADRSSIVAGTSVNVRVYNTSQLNEPLVPFFDMKVPNAQRPADMRQWPTRGGLGTRLYGKWNIGLAWN